MCPEKLETTEKEETVYEKPDPPDPAIVTSGAEKPIEKPAMPNSDDATKKED